MNNEPWKAIDGDGTSSSLWHNIWNNGTGNGNLPQALVIDMGDEERVSQLELDRRNDNNTADVHTVEIYVGMDADTAPLVGTFLVIQATKRLQDVYLLNLCKLVI